MGALPRIQDFNDAAYNPFTAAKTDGGDGRVKNYYPELKRLRDENPVFEGDPKVHFGAAPDHTLKGVRHVAVLGAREVRHVLTDVDTYSVKAYTTNLGVYFGRSSITMMDNPEHFHFRQFFQQAFGPRMIAQWGQEIIPRLIRGLIDRFETRGRAELVSEFAQVFPFHFIHELMGLPMEDRETFHRLAVGQILLTFDPEHGLEAVDKLRDYLTQMVAARRAAPIDGDFMSMIVTAEVNGERLPDEVVISFFRQILSAGGDTTYKGFSTLLFALLTHPDQFEAVKKDRSLVPKAMEEALRWESPVGMISRTPKHPVELCGVEINPGDHMGIILPAANRDPAMFPHPDDFDIRRGARAHLVFGFGPHICIGQHLARLEMVSAMNALLDRLPRLRRDENMPPPEVSGFMHRSPDKVYVRFD